MILIQCCLLIYLVQLSLQAVPHEAHHANSSRGDFIYIENARFYKGCSPHYLVSMNYWGVMSVLLSTPTRSLLALLTPLLVYKYVSLHRNLAADTSAGGNLTRFKTEVQQLSKIGVNNVRIVSLPFPPAKTNARTQILINFICVKTDGCLRSLGARHSAL
jgi:hypothetical protein